MDDCPPHPSLGLECDSTRPDHKLCTAKTEHPGIYTASWVRVWWRDGHPFKNPVLKR